MRCGFDVQRHLLTSKDNRGRGDYETLSQRSGSGPNSADSRPLQPRSTPAVDSAVNPRSWYCDQDRTVIEAYGHPSEQRLRAPGKR